MHKNMLNNTINLDNKLNEERNNERPSDRASNISSDSDNEYNVSKNVVEYNNHINNISSGEENNTAYDIDKIFINIRKLYSEQDFIIIFNTLQLLVKNPHNYILYMEGLNKILDPINKEIQKWIVDNIVY